MSNTDLQPQTTPATDRLTVFYDGACPVCSLEMGHLAQRDAACRLALVDIAAPGFDAQAHGFSASALDAEIHAVSADGSVVRGMAALRLAYSTAGLGWLLKPTGNAALKPFFDAAYRVFARHRRPISRALAPWIAATAARRARQALQGRSPAP